MSKWCAKFQNGQGTNFELRNKVWTKTA